MSEETLICEEVFEAIPDNTYEEAASHLTDEAGGSRNVRCKHIDVLDVCDLDGPSVIFGKKKDFYEDFIDAPPPPIIVDDDGWPTSSAPDPAYPHTVSTTFFL